MSGLTSFELNMGEMVHNSKSTEAKKSMAMSFVRNTGRISNGEREDVGRISDAVLSMTPILLEMYLEHHITVSDVDAAIERHVASCPMKVAEAMPESMGWQRLFLVTVKSIGWPGAMVLIALILKYDILKVFSGL